MFVIDAKQLYSIRFILNLLHARSHSLVPVYLVGALPQQALPGSFWAVFESL